MTYAFRCLNCRARFERDYPMSDTEGRSTLSCAECGSTSIGRDFSAVQFRFRIGWRNITHYDALPDDVKGAGPHSKAHRDYANHSHGSREL